MVRKLSTRSIPGAVTVPNSVGPGKLMMRFGAQAQRDDWLPRLADGREIPGFGLTSPEAGCDNVIGGPERVGQGWRMLMTALAAGRGISLPAQSKAGPP